MKIAFVKPPFYRLVGSHNNKVPVELSYYAAYCERAGHEVFIYNGDATSATKYCSWRELMRRSTMLESAIDCDEHPMIFEIVEAVMSQNPDVVVVSNDDTFMPSVCNDMPFFAGKLAKAFTQHGHVPVVGVGTFWQLDIQLAACVDTVIKGSPNSGIVPALIQTLKKKTLVTVTVDLGPMFEDIQPHLTNVQPIARPDFSYVVSARGCSFPCAFCYNTKVSNKFQERTIEAFCLDLRERYWNSPFSKSPGSPYQNRFYITDQIFTRNLGRLVGLSETVFDYVDREVTFTAEGRSELIRKGGDPMAYALKTMHVDYVKIGVENVGAQFNAGMKKNQVSDGIAEAVQILRNQGIRVGAYLMLGGTTTVDEYKQTLDFCNEIDFDGYIISMLSQPMSELNTDKYRYDTHWSLARQPDYNVPNDVLNQYLLLQESKTGNLDLQLL